MLVLDTEDEDQEIMDEILNLEMQVDGIIEHMHIIIMIIMNCQDEIIKTSKETRPIVPLRNIVCGPGPIEPTVRHLESWAVSDNSVSEALNTYEANDIWVQHWQDP